MILWCDGAHEPVENMERDRSLLERLSWEATGAAPAGEAVLRLFRFEPHGITLGLAQRQERVLDLDRCRADGVPWAVRPTGGRAIFHADEWTYSLCAAIADPEWGGNLGEAYARASRLILASLLRLGVPVEFATARGAGAADTPAGEAPRTARVEGPKPVAAPAAADAAASPPWSAHDPAAGPARACRPATACFASTARHEIVLHGRKLVGSAQRRTSRALLQQGSVLLGHGHLRLADYLAADAAACEAARRALAAKSAVAGAYLGADLGLERWADALCQVLGNGAHRVDGATGAFLLTAPETAPYTPPRG